MVPEVIIRPATHADVPELVRLLAELFAIEADFTFDACVQERGLSRMLESMEGCCIMVAECHQTVIGMCSVQTLVSTAEGGEVGLVEDLVVSPPYRGQGIGSELLASIEQWARDNDLRRLQLLADQDNAPALDFYQKHHWQRTQLICLRKTWNK